LDDDEGARVVPVLEELLSKKRAQEKISSSGMSADGSTAKGTARLENGGTDGGAEKSKRGTGGSRRRWTNRSNPG
jgi:hypothetical protein